jgi:exodeoxyribonuclease III
VREWDETFRGYLRFLDAKKPVVLGGDLNVCDLDIDIYNVDAPHVKKSAGLTPEERASFSEKLLGKTDPSGSAPGTFLLDAFRRYHPTASGWFTYWSGRVGNRPKNRGLRLDYFLCSRRMCSDRSEVPGTDPKGDVRLVDGFILDRITVGASDHAPLGVTLATPPP